MDYYLKRYEICYYQGQYEETKDTTWLDKKKTALTELDSIYTSFYSLPKVQALIKANIDTWKEENITAIQDKNKVTTDTLTSELEKALGVSKDAITKKQAELAALQKEADQAKTNYESINPNQSDIYLSEQYETVMKQLEEKASELKTSQERLEALKAALTLHDLTNVGENAMAVGTDALATGSNSMAVGTNAVAVGENAIAVGNGATVTGSNSIAIGYGNAVLGDNSGAFGDPNTVYGSGSYAIGNDNTIGAVDSSTSTPVIDKGNNTFVLGSKVTTTANNAVVLGYGSEATEDDVVSVGSSTSKRRIINLADGTADTDAVTLGQVKSLMGNGNAVEYDGDGHNIVTFDGASGTKLTGLKQGTLSKTSTDAVTGSQLYATNLSIAGFAADIKKNAADITALSSSIADHESSTISATSLVQTLSDCKMDLSLANINTSGENKIRSIVREMLTEDAETTASLFSLASTPATLEMDYPVAVVNEANNTVQIIDGENTTVTSYSQDGFSTYSINVSNDAIKNAVKDDLNKKADTSYVNEQLATKANADASNLTESDLNAWSSALGIGEVAENNAGLVNGATVYKAISKMEKANNLVQASGSKLTIGKDDTSSTVDFTNKNGEYRTVTGIITDGTDASSAANVAYVQNTAYSLYNGFNEQINSMYSNLNRDINKGVAGAAALAALHQLDYDPDDKFNFAVGYGHHKNANATALGAFYYANANTMFSLGATFGNGSTTFNAGVAFKIGHGSNYNGLSKAAMASEIKDLEERIRKLEALLTPQQ